MSHRRPEPVKVVDYDRAWPDEFERLRARVAETLGELVLRVEHVGSTAVAGTAAKPIVDMYVVVKGAESVRLATERLGTLGYVPEGPLGVPGRLGFAWPPGEKRHHLYLCTPEQAVLASVVRFRDYLRSHPHEVREYSQLKRTLAARHQDDPDAYAEGKRPFIEAALGREVGW